MEYIGIGFIASIAGTYFLFRFLMNKKSEEEIIASHKNDSKNSIGRKYPEANVESQSSLFTRIGIAIALLFIILAFEWTTYDQTISDLGTLAVAEDTEVEPPLTKQEQLPPPPPPPPILQIVEEEVKEDVPQVQETEATPETVVPQIVEAPEEKVEEQQIFTIVEEMPAFPGCDNISNEDEKKKCTDAKIFAYVSSNVKYPPIAKENGITGRVFIQFVIGPDGKATNVKVLRGIGGGCDEEAIRVISSMPKWKPGKQRGKNVSVSYNLPVNFKLVN